MVKAGVRYRSHPIGVLEVLGVTAVKLGQVSDAEAQRSGFASAQELAEYLAAMQPVDASTELWRVELRHVGDDDAKAVAYESALSPEDVAALTAKLERLDRASTHGPWTMAVLDAIRRRPATRAADLAAEEFGRERDPFKIDVRKLKNLGLTHSLEVGYELSPRGEEYLRRTTRTVG